jgi:hypothetical protein
MVTGLVSRNKDGENQDGRRMDMYVRLSNTYCMYVYNIYIIYVKIYVYIYIYIKPPKRRDGEIGEIGRQWNDGRGIPSRFQSFEVLGRCVNWHNNHG